MSTNLDETERVVKNVDIQDEEITNKKKKSKKTSTKVIEETNEEDVVANHDEDNDEVDDEDDDEEDDDDDDDDEEDDDDDDDDDDVLGGITEMGLYNILGNFLADEDGKTIGSSLSNIASELNKLNHNIKKYCNCNKNNQ